MSTEVPASNKPLQPLGLGSSDQLGSLPAPAYDLSGYGGAKKAYAYSAEQMRAYAAQEVAAEREACAKIADAKDDMMEYGAGEEIRARSRRETADHALGSALEAVDSIKPPNVAGNRTTVSGSG
jgi:hypothetical protein